MEFICWYPNIEIACIWMGQRLYMYWYPNMYGAVPMYVQAQPLISYIFPVIQQFWEGLSVLTFYSIIILLD